MSEWKTIEVERALYVDDGVDRILCDRLPSPVTLVVKFPDPPSPQQVEGEG